MKLTIIGGGGVRTPLIVNGLIRWRENVPVDRLVLYDIDATKMTVIGGLVKRLAEQNGSPFHVECTTDLRRAVEGADFIYTAIRVGGEKGRVIDERVPLRYGVIGQETTGPGGFAMALRTIPVMLEYAKVIEEEAPDAWVINFTNPSGLITEALRKHANLKVIGICDAPSSMRVEIARFLGVEADRVFIHYQGLNHLGWIRRVLVDGRDRLPEIIQRYREFVQGFPHMACFPEELIRHLKLLPNEYLYYYYYREQAVRNILESGRTRGERIVEWNDHLFRQLGDLWKAGQVEEAFDTYTKVMSERNSTYMANETGSAPAGQQVTLEAEGYEGLAMSIIEAIGQNKRTTLVLNVSNNGAIPDLSDEDVVEVSCVLDANGPVPLVAGALPDSVKGLVQSVKEYERLTVSAAVDGSYEDALMALTVHPLVGSASLAQHILDDYLREHAAYLPQFAKRGARNGQV